MTNIYPGQQVRIKSFDELQAEYGFDPDDYDGFEIGGIELTHGMAEYCDGTYMVTDYDKYDGTIYIGETDYWWHEEMVTLVSDPDSFFGFKVGDRIEFRQYDDMKADGSLRFNHFVTEMRNLCGTTGVITSICPANGLYANITVNNSEGNEINWHLNTAMIEHPDDSSPVVIEDWAIIAFS